MGNVVSSVNVNNSMKAGLCPHGTIPGACPICSGMGGGGLRPGERVQKPGEMSYHECAMIGAMMRAREAQQKMHEQNLKLHADAMKTFEHNIIFAAQKMADFAANIQSSVLLKPVVVVINQIVIPILKSIASLSNVISNIGQKLVQFKEKFFDIQDKLNAIFGEVKAFIEKKVSELVSNIKSKIETLFKVFKRNNTRDEENKIDEDKRIFMLKTFIQKILNRENKKDDSENKSGS